MSIEPNSIDAASTSQVRLKDAHLGGLMEKQQGNPSHQEEEDSEDSDNPEAENWDYKSEPVARNSNAWEQPLAHGANSSIDKESQKDTKATWKHHLQISPNTAFPWSGKSMANTIPWKFWSWIWLFGECSWIPLFEQRFISYRNMKWNLGM